MLKKNEQIPLTITGMTGEGNGVGRVAAPGSSHDGLAVFVPGTALGDEIVCHVTKVCPGHAYGRVVVVTKPSPDRLEGVTDETLCLVSGRCGGCVWRHVTYEAELRYKWQQVADTLRRIGGCAVEPLPIIGSIFDGHPVTEGYRNKAQYPVVAGPYRPLIGFYAPRSHRIVEQHDCRLQPPVFGRLVDAVVRWAKRAQVAGYDETTRQGLLRHICLRHGEATGEIMVCLVCTSGKLPQTDWLVQLLREAAPGLTSVIVNLNRRDTNVILGDEEFVLWGQSYITDRLCGKQFRLSARSFYQVHRRQAERLYGLAAEAAALTGRETVLDLYCGTGTIGLTLADRAGQVLGVELEPAAIEDARFNAAANGIANARFLCADAAVAARQLREEDVRPEVVLLDPPRKGCEETLLNTVAALQPDRVVYISCNPATLARDIRRLDGQGYRLHWAQPVDMFPRTAHVETIALLSRALKEKCEQD